MKTMTVTAATTIKQQLQTQQSNNKERSQITTVVDASACCAS
jgi:hypothetical protein